MSVAKNLAAGRILDRVSVDGKFERVNDQIIHQDAGGTAIELEVDRAS